MQFNPAAFLERKLQTEDQALIAEAIRLMNWCHYKRGDLIVKEGNPIADYRFLASEGGCPLHLPYCGRQGNYGMHCIKAWQLPDAQCGAECAVPG